MDHITTEYSQLLKTRSSAPVPAYYRLQEHIKAKIENGDWKPGEAIPPERVIAAESRLSIGTVKKALQNLVYEGLLSRVQGKGTFVAGTVLSRGSLRYYRLMENFNDEIARLSISLLEIRKNRNSDSARESLGLKKGDKLIEIRRLFSTGGDPVVYTSSFLPQKMFKGFCDLPGPLFEKSTLYETIERNYGLPCFYNEELFGAVSADDGVADLLKIKKSFPLLFIEMRSFTYKDVPYEYRISYCLTDRIKVFAEI